MEKHKIIYLSTILLNACVVLGMFFNVFTKGVVNLNNNGQTIDGELYVNFFEYSASMGRSLWSFVFLIPIFVLLLSIITLIILVFVKKRWNKDKKLLLIQTFCIALLFFITLFANAILYMMICLFAVIIQAILYVLIEKVKEN